MYAEGLIMYIDAKIIEWLPKSNETILTSLEQIELSPNLSRMQILEATTQQYPTSIMSDSHPQTRYSNKPPPKELP